MQLPEISIRRPVFASVLSMLILLVGAVAFKALTVREYPKIDEPTVSVQTRFAGASSEVTVMQAPLCAMLSPRATSSRYPGGASMVSRLPWSKELPRARRSAMRPTPVMMPVNIGVFSQGLWTLDLMGA